MCHRRTSCNKRGFSHDVVSSLQKENEKDIEVYNLYRQMWTAFGIMIGFVADLAFFRVPNKPHIKGLNWRLMLASVSKLAFLHMFVS